MSQTLAATRLMRSSPIEAAACEAVSNDIQCIYPKCPLLVFGKQLADELNAGKLVSRRSAASMLRASTGKWVSARWVVAVRLDSCRERRRVLLRPKIRVGCPAQFALDS